MLLDACCINKKSEIDVIRQYLISLQQMLSGIDEPETIKEYLQKIYQDRKIKVNNAIIELPETTAESSTKFISQSMQRYESTKNFSKFDQRWDTRDEASIAYGLANQGRVLFIQQLDYNDLISGNVYQDQPILNQTLLWPALQRDFSVDLIHTHVFLNFELEYMSPRPIDVLIIHPDIYRKSANKSLNSILNRAAEYDFVFSPNSSGMAEDLNTYIARNPGIVRCAIYY